MRRRVSRLLPWKKNHRMPAPPVRCRLLALEKTMQLFARASSASARLCPPSHGHSPPAFRPYLPDLGSLWLSKQPQKLFLNIKSSNHFCTHHLFVGFLVQLPTIIGALSASCAPRTRVLGLESTDRALHSHSHFAFPQIGKKHHRSRLRRRTHCAARAAALRVVDRTDGITTRPLSDLSWYPPRASSQRRGLPSSCVVHKFSILRRGQILCRSR